MARLQKFILDFWLLANLTSPCIYGWRRGNQYLYIGKSKKGIVRSLNKHHAIDLAEVQQGDELDVFYPISEATIKGKRITLDFLEMKLIQKFQPPLNQVFALHHMRNGKVLVEDQDYKVLETHGLTQ